ncbi:hypothetical protein WMF18_13945 [Sorangium sp. So ce315]
MNDGVVSSPMRPVGTPQAHAARRPEIASPLPRSALGAHLKAPLG